MTTLTTTPTSAGAIDQDLLAKVAESDLDPSLRLALNAVTRSGIDGTTRMRREPSWSRAPAHTRRKPHNYLTYSPRKELRPLFFFFSSSATGRRHAARVHQAPMCRWNSYRIPPSL